MSESKSVSKNKQPINIGVVGGGQLAQMLCKAAKKKNISGITISTSGTPQVLQQIKLQLRKLVPVHKVADFPSNKKTLMREMALLKVVSSKTQLEKARKLCKKYKYTLLDKTEKSFVFEVSALKKEIDELIKKLQPLGLASASRTGVVAMTKGSEIYQQN